MLRYSTILLGAIVGHAIALPVSSMPSSTLVSQEKRGDRDLTEAQIEAIARSITVKVHVDRSWGSGILVRKRGQTYLVVTNQHVVAFGDRFSIQTADARIYPAKTHKIAFGDRDLTVLEFQAKSNYAIAHLDRTSKLKVGDEVFAAGFPSEIDRIDRVGNNAQKRNPLGFNFAAGRISILTAKEIAGGYQIGCTNDLRKGMSGGPLLNRRGQVIGIDGMHAYPIWGDPYVFTDGSRPERAQHELMVQSSWAIPIETFIKLFKAY